MRNASASASHAAFGFAVPILASLARPWRNSGSREAASRRFWVTRVWTASRIDGTDSPCAKSETALNASVSSCFVMNHRPRRDRVHFGCAAQECQSGSPDLLKLVQHCNLRRQGLVELPNVIRTHILTG